MLKIIRELEVPLYLLIIAFLVYNNSIILAIILISLSLVRLVLNYWGFNEFYKNLEDSQQESEK